MTLTLVQHDADRIRRAREGDERAFAELVRSYSGPVYHFVYKMVRSRETADELTQEVFVKIYKNLTKFDGRRPFKPWLFRIANNTTVSWLRSQKQVVSLDALPQEPPEATSANPEARMSLNRLAEALDELEPKYRRVLVLRYQEGLSYDEMAEALDIPLNTVRTWLRRARQALKTTLQEETL